MARTGRATCNHMVWAALRSPIPTPKESLKGPGTSQTAKSRSIKSFQTTGKKGVGQVIGLSRVSRGIPHLPIHNYYSVISMIESRNYIYTGNLEEDCSKKLVKDS